MSFQLPDHFSLLQPTALAPGSAISPFNAQYPPWTPRSPHRGIDIPNVYGAYGFEPCDGRFVEFTGGGLNQPGGDFGPYAFCIQWYDWLAGNYADIFVLVAHNSAIGPGIRPGNLAFAGRLSYLVGNLGKTDGGAHVHLQISSTPAFPVDIAYSADPEPFMVKGNPMDILQRISTIEGHVNRLNRLVAGNGYGRVPGIPRSEPASIALRDNDALQAADADGASLFLGLGDTQADVDKLRSERVD